ncbi:MAG: DNA repair protein RecO [Prevotella sp.]|nr:DNA repair protein RecO [Prevotella sp.]
MFLKTEAIVLHALKYGDGRIIVDMFTREQGRLSFIVPMPRSERAKIKKQYLQPLTLLLLEADVRQQSQLQKLRDVSLLLPLPSLLSDPKKLSIGLFVSEFLYHALKGEQENAPLFDYVRSSIAWIDGAQGSVANFHLVFLMRLSRFLGFFPNLESTGTYFDLRGAEFCEAPPLHRDFLMPEEAEHISLLMRMDYPTMHLFKLNHAQRTRILEIMLTYYRLHLPDFPELKSLGVLQEMYK